MHRQTRHVVCAFWCMDPEDKKAHIETVLEDEVAQVESPSQARSVIRKAEARAGQDTQEQRGQAVASTPESALESVDRASTTGPATTQAAATLTAVAAEAVAPTEEAEVVSEAARQVVSGPAPTRPETRRGLDLLRHELLERMQPHEWLDARLFIAVNTLPHPDWLYRVTDAITVTFNGGWIWLGATATAELVGLRGGKHAGRELVLPLLTTTWVVEHPVKSFFRRKRPFIDIVRALVVGKKPGTWSFPSGHTASSFAAATILSRCWPRRRAYFFGVASLVGFSRIYAGAHYPGDVAAGAGLGVVLATVARLLVSQLKFRR
jgi:membrane-associated phospholipid phosphatase